ncbi:hypothetical protein NXY00_20550 [Bacteroides sp. BFG-551]|nr:hypothetical protein [Bacteroides sp. BFG-551]
MMKKYKLISAVLALGLCMPFGLLTTSCEDMLEEKPYDFISPGEIENSDGGADMWVIGVYNVLHTGMFIYGSFPRPLDYDCDYISGAVGSSPSLVVVIFRAVVRNAMHCGQECIL